jgi:hypothetical protein
MFGWFNSQVDFWHLDCRNTADSDELQPPPVVALLCLCSEAAKGMGATGMNASDFYGPLAELLGLDRYDRALVSGLGESYRTVVKGAWACLDTWCTSNEGQRGLTSAFVATGFPYVGLAVSQALVRQNDRRHFPDFFRQYRLSPQAVTQPAELEISLSEWLASPGSPASQNFRSIWSKADVRPRVVEIVMRELEQSTGPRGAVVGERRLTLEASVRAFPATRITWSLVVENARHEDSVSAVIEWGGRRDEISLQPTLDGELYVDLVAGDFDQRSNALFERFSLELPDDQVSRIPKRLLLLTKNALTGRYEESPRIGLGQSSLVATRHAIDAESVRWLLHAHAQPDWKEVALGSELGSGGIAFVGVRVKDQDFEPNGDWLRPLVPREPSALSLEGGLSLGRQAWLLNRPPSILATVAGNRPHLLRLISTEDEQSPRDVSDSVLSPTESGWQFNEEGLRPGRYRVELIDTRAQTVLRAANIRLVTSDTVDVRAWRRSSRLIHDWSVDGPFAAVTAGPVRGGVEDFVEGVSVTGPERPVSGSVSGKVPAWWQTLEQVETKMNRRYDEAGDTPADWNDAVEALMYIGGGSAATLASIARQVMPSEDFAAWRFWRACSDLGHIEVTIDDSFAPRAWRLVRPQLAGTSEGDWLLCGYWSRKAQALLEERLPGSLERLASSHGPASTYLRSVPLHQVEQAVQLSGVDALVVPEAAQMLITALPELGALVQALPGSTIPAFDVINKFEPNTQRWIKQERIDSPGAYRASIRRMQRYLVVTESELAQGRCRFADADLAKHIAASMAGSPFIAYHPKDRVMATPFGVRLPFLFGRAATLCSGRLSKQKNNSWTVYEAVPPQFASEMTRRFQWKDPA